MSVTVHPEITAWAPAPRPPRRPPVETTAESAECTCPDVCERDHELD
jgi:hypothetical protein